jgi:hypothetical protein
MKPLVPSASPSSLATLPFVIDVCKDAEGSVVPEYRILKSRRQRIHPGVVARFIEEALVAANFESSKVVPLSTRYNRGSYYHTWKLTPEEALAVNAYFTSFGSHEAVTAHLKGLRKLFPPTAPTPEPEPTPENEDEDEEDES